MMAQRFEPIRSIIIDSDLSGIEKLRKILSLAIISAKQEIANHSSSSYQKNPQLLVIHTERPHELSQMILLFLNVWVNPWMYQWSPEKMRNIFVFMKDIKLAIGIRVKEKNAM